MDWRATNPDKPIETPLAGILQVNGMGERVRGHLLRSKNHARAVIEGHAHDSITVRPPSSQGDLAPAAVVPEVSILNHQYRC